MSNWEDEGRRDKGRRLDNSTLQFCDKLVQLSDFVKNNKKISFISGVDL
jgi:hypothetical protein